MKFGAYYNALSRYNILKHKGRPPSVEFVNQVVKLAGISQHRFEHVYGFSDKAIMRYVNGTRGLPAVYWHIFYEFDTLDKFYINFNLTLRRVTPHSVRKVKKENPVIATNNKNLIDAYRATINKR